MEWIAEYRRWHARQVYPGVILVIDSLPVALHLRLLILASDITSIRSVSTTRVPSFCFSGWQFGRLRWREQGQILLVLVFRL